MIDIFLWLILCVAVAILIVLFITHGIKIDDDEAYIEQEDIIVPAESPSPMPTDPAPIRDVYYVMTKCDFETGTVTYELRERSET